MDLRSKTDGQLCDEYAISLVRYQATKRPEDSMVNDQYREILDGMDLDMECMDALIELMDVNAEIWHLIDLVMADKHTREDARRIQTLNQLRSELIRHIDKRRGCRDIGEKVYAYRNAGA